MVLCVNACVIVFLEMTVIACFAMSNLAIRNKIYSTHVPSSVVEGPTEPLQLKVEQKKLHMGAKSKCVYSNQW